MKHKKLGLNHQNQNFVLIMTTDDGGGVLVLDVGWWETRGIVTEGFQIFFESFEIFLLPNIFQTHLYAGRGKGGHKSNSRVHPSFI